MSRPSLLDALERALEPTSRNGFRHHSPPPESQVATTKSLTTQGVYHLRHFRHQDGANPDDDVRTGVNCIAGGGVADKQIAIQPRVSLLRDSGGESGESQKKDGRSAAYLLPPDCGAVAEGGKSGKSHETEPALLAHLRAALLYQRDAVRPPPASDAARRHDRLNRWLSCHPPPPCPPNVCAHCGGEIGERPRDAVPVLRSLQPAEPIWLHLACSYDWYDQRLAAAAAELSEEPAADGEAP